MQGTDTATYRVKLEREVQGVGRVTSAGKREGTLALLVQYSWMRLD